MRTQVIEVDEDVFQITTEFETGEITVELVMGYEAYELHMQREYHATNQGQRAGQGNLPSVRH